MRVEIPHRLPEKMLSSRGAALSFRFWVMKDDNTAAVEGCGFTVTGTRSTNFWTYSDFQPEFLQSDYQNSGGSPHQAYMLSDTLTRGFGLSDTDRDMFLQAWIGNSKLAPSGFWGQYLAARRARPPKTYTLEGFSRIVSPTAAAHLRAAL